MATARRTVAKRPPPKSLFLRSMMLIGLTTPEKAKSLRALYRDEINKGRSKKVVSNG